MIYVNNCIPHRLLKDHTGVYMSTEFMTIEISVKSSKWKLCYIYINHLKLRKKISVTFCLSCAKYFYRQQSLSIFRRYEL